MALSFKEILRYYFFWIINITLNLLRFKKRDKNLWIFGAWGGNKFNDNTKYLFKYVHENEPKIQAVWITSKNTIKDEIIKMGYTCYLYNEKEGRKARLNAGYIFYTNGISDVGKINLCHGAKIVALWHGMPLKRLWFATNYFKHKKLRTILRYYTLKIYYDKQRDYTIATSETTKTFLQECFEVNPDSILITGQPRNDILFDSKISTLIKSKLNHLENEKFILYMPTWRDMDLKGDSFLDNVLKELYEDSQFLESLANKKIKLYVKPHPNLKLQAKSQANVVIIDESIDIDSQELLVVADAFITDYSSAFIDYALLKRPIYFFTPDIEEYEKGSLGTFLSFNEFAQHWESTISGFIELILNGDEGMGCSNTQLINSIYNDPTLKEGQYSRNVVEALRK
ncbi:MAG: CDP-glycerol glycerophosphotransferase family protein [Brumimicrobium sp.]|nr:CDP-glycerol glycerophosphotransferase family protein [Brumimicrobium sp.]